MLTYIAAVSASVTAPAAASTGPTITDWITAVSAILTTLVAIAAAWYARRQWVTARQGRLDAIDAEVARAQP